MSRSSQNKPVIIAFAGAAVAVAGVLLLNHLQEKPGEMNPGFEADTETVPLQVENVGTGGREVQETPGPVSAVITHFPAGTVEGEVILTFRDQAALREYLAQAALAGVRPLGVATGIGAVRMRADDLSSVGSGEAQVDYNYVVSAPVMPEPRAPDGTEYVGFGNDAISWLGGNDVSSSWGNGVKIAVLDTGVDPATPVAGRLSGTINVAGTTDSMGHGTAIATLLLGEEGRVAGVAPAAEVLSVRVVGPEGSGDSFSLAQGIISAVDQGARVLNISLGSYGDSAAVENAVRYAQDRNAVIVAAAGNEATDAVVYPARYEGVLAVTATDAEGVVPYFGNRGNEVDIAAPGVGVLTRWDAESGISFTGTSAAVPFVSGAVAGLMSQEPYRPAAEIAALVMQYSDDAGAPGQDPVYGTGILSLDRLTERNTPGIYDIAIADYYVDAAKATSAGVPVIVSTQNRGTATLLNVLVEANVGGNVTQTYLDRIEPGKTGTHTVFVPAGTETAITASARSLVSGTTASPETRFIAPVSGTPVP